MSSSVHFSTHSPTLSPHPQPSAILDQGSLACAADLRSQCLGAQAASGARAAVYTGRVGQQKGPRLARLAIFNKRNVSLFKKEIARRARRARRGIWLAAPPPGRVQQTQEPQTLSDGPDIHATWTGAEVGRSTSKLRGARKRLSRRLGFDSGEGA